MKKILGLIAAFLLANSVFAYQNFLSFNVGLLSGIPFYGNSGVNDCNKEVEDQSRIIVGGLAAINLNVSDMTTFFLDSDVLTDFIWHSGEHSNHIAYDFGLGIKIYPNIAGFGMGLSYVLGARSDFVDTEKTAKFSDTSAWGNGFKLLAEYNFAHDGKSKHLPTLGMFWKCMPRGNNDFDNMLCAYAALNF